MERPLSAVHCNLAVGSQMSPNTTYDIQEEYCTTVVIEVLDQLPKYVRWWIYCECEARAGCVLYDVTLLGRINQRALCL
jgi:hypothetical protein